MGDFDLTLPGDLPGLLRRGSPVIIDGRTSGVVIRTMSDGTAFVADHDGRISWWPLRCLALDLSDASGRAHAAWWLAQQVYPNGRGCLRAFWAEYSIPHRIYQPSLHMGDGLHAGCVNDWLTAVRMADGWTIDTPADRYTEALRLVCLHCAEVPRG